MEEWRRKRKRRKEEKEKEWKERKRRRAVRYASTKIFSLLDNS
jgi:hypothetical protein